MHNGLEKLKALTESLLVKDRQLRYAEEIYRGVFNTLPLPIIVLCVDDFTLVDANAEAVKVFGYTYEEIMQLKAWTKSMNPEYTKKVITSQELEAEGAFIHKDGHIIKTSSSLRHFILNEQEYCIVVLTIIGSLELMEGDPDDTRK